MKLDSIGNWWSAGCQDVMACFKQFEGLNQKVGLDEAKSVMLVVRQEDERVVGEVWSWLFEQERDFVQRALAI